MQSTGDSGSIENVSVKAGQAQRDDLETLAIWISVALFILACACLASC